MTSFGITFTYSFAESIHFIHSCVHSFYSFNSLHFIQFIHFIPIIQFTVFHSSHSNSISLSFLSFNITSSFKQTTIQSIHTPFLSYSCSTFILQFTPHLAIPHK